EVNDNAIELSGGEKQKLALARALYKDAPVIILDEPTAALDPIAESEVYQKYAELTDGKTSIYISHRLASTRFCDRIFFMDNHSIAEVGSHDELMRLGGRYAEMFEVQAHYYQEGVRGQDGEVAAG
ncbi:MAG TPA: ABC transporter ATP-binding protein, partial [Firmicutes bacterium]|nr:ABC transporter ATP-binding protein [Bacillota bacterium]